MSLGRLAIAALLINSEMALAQAKITSDEPRDTTHAQHQAPFFTRKDALLGVGRHGHDETDAAPATVAAPADTRVWRPRGGYCGSAQYSRAGVFAAHRGRWAAHPAGAESPQRAWRPEFYFLSGARDSQVRLPSSP